MGISIAIVNENGLKIERINDDKNILHRLLPDHDNDLFSLINTIDWYGDTVFNYLQIPLFLDEWNKLPTSITDDEEQLLIEGVKTMANKVLNNRHLYLKFIGD